MAVQLERFLREQLGQPNLPDRGFIEATLARVLTYQRGKDQPVHEYFRGLKTGPLVDRPLIERAFADPDRSLARPKISAYASTLTHHIGIAGDESTAHLCLPAKEILALSREKRITTISQLRDLLYSGDLTAVRTLGPKSESEVIKALAAFDQLKNQQREK